MVQRVQSFKYLGSIISDKGSKPEVLARRVQTTAALAKLKPILKDSNITISSKLQLVHSQVISIFLYS